MADICRGDFFECRRRVPTQYAHAHAYASITATMESIRPALATLRIGAPRRAYRPLYQCLHTSAQWRATPLPHPSVPGPPPGTPTPQVTDALERVARKKRQAEMMKEAKDLKATSAPSNKPKALLKKRFWKDVTVKETEGQ